VEVVTSLSPGRTAAAQCGLFTHKSVPVIFEPLCIFPVYVFACNVIILYLIFEYLRWKFSLRHWSISVKGKNLYLHSFLRVGF